MTKKDFPGDEENFLEKAQKLGKEFLLYIKQEVIPSISGFLDRISLKKLRAVYPFAIILNLFLFIFIVYSIFFSKNSWQGDADKLVEIRKGTGLGEIAEQLHKENVIGNVYTFKLAARITGKDGNILPRRYLFSSGITNTEILGLLTDKDLVQTVKFRVPEGVTIRKLSASVEKNLLSLFRQVCCCN